MQLFLQGDNGVHGKARIFKDARDMASTGSLVGVGGVGILGLNHVCLGHIRDGRKMDGARR